MMSQSARNKGKSDKELEPALFSHETSSTCLYPSAPSESPGTEKHVNAANKTSVPLTYSAGIREDANKSSSAAMQDAHEGYPYDEIQLDEIIIKSSLQDKNPEKQWQQVLDAFNAPAKKTGKSCFVHSTVRGQWINRDEFLLGHRNKTAELAGFNGEYNTARLLHPSPNVVTEIIHVCKQNELFYGAHGSYVLNVPIGHYAKAKSGNNPMIFGPGPHVIHDPNFRFDMKNGLVKQTDALISHENINIVRVTAGNVAKVWIGSEPVILEARKMPYVFTSPLFRYEYNKIDDKQYLYHQATEKLIVHGSIKRLIPHTSEVAVTYNNGNLVIITPNMLGKPEIIDNPFHEVRGFLSTAIQTLIFPDKNEYLEFTTSDSLKVQVKLLVAYKITDPVSALTALDTQEEIIKHIKSVAITDMARAVQKCTSQEFLASYRNTPKREAEMERKRPDSVSLLHDTVVTFERKPYQDEVKDKLSEDLKKIGIELQRFNIEEAKFKDAEISRKMGESSIQAAQANAEASILEQQYEITKRRAEQEAEKQRIAQQQQNQAIMSKAEAELEASKKRAEAIVIEAEADRKANSLRGQVLHDNPELLQLEMAKVAFLSLEKASLNVTSQDMAVLLRNPLGFFGAIQKSSASGTPVLSVIEESTEKTHRQAGAPGK